MNAPLNFARKWRSQTFDQLVGQDISVRILKNSLYVNHCFPLYLFSGQRGCGKTTMARIFAMALNCQNLPQFQKDPKNFSVPCLTCASCSSMSAGKHPDFIEIDGASYTGVDNVRHIIDTAALMPLTGRKKIYLIDEAHMLSKAAFNAFLKVLEDPPASVIFILATTEIQKIIETVKSRSFQLFFKAVPKAVLADYLEHICASEKIAYEKDGLLLIAQESQGSVRDALNLLEQARFAVSVVTRSSVSAVLGHLEDALVFALLETILAGNIKAMLTLLKDFSSKNIAADVVWQSLCTIAHAALLAHYELSLPYFNQYKEQLKDSIDQHSSEKIHHLLKTFYENEVLFSKVRNQYIFLELMLLRFRERKAATRLPDHSPSEPSTMQPSSPTNVHEAVVAEDEQHEVRASVQTNDRWQIFLDAIEQLNDPLLSSVFKQVHALAFDETTHVLTLNFAKDFIFFNEWLENTQASWQPLLKKVFGPQAVCKPVFIALASDQASVLPKTSALPRAQPEQTRVQAEQKNYKPSVPLRSAPAPTYSYNVRKTPPKQVSSFDVSDASVWKNAALILHHFPGTVHEVKESSYE